MSLCDFCFYATQKKINSFGFWFKSFSGSMYPISATEPKTQGFKTHSKKKILRRSITLLSPGERNKKSSQVPKVFFCFIFQCEEGRKERPPSSLHTRNQIQILATFGWESTLISWPEGSQNKPRITTTRKKTVLFSFPIFLSLPLSSLPSLPHFYSPPKTVAERKKQKDRKKLTPLSQSQLKQHTHLTFHPENEN